MPESEQNAEDDHTGSAVPTSVEPLSQSVDEGLPDAHSSGRTSPGKQSSPKPAPISQTDQSTDDPDHQSNGGGEPEGKNGYPLANDVGDAKDVLEEFDWADLEDRFCAAMDKFKKTEEEIGEEFKEWLELHSAVPLMLSPRLRTRMAWVQMAETNLEEKRVHCVKVKFGHGWPWVPKIGILQLEMDKLMDHRDCFPQTGIEGTVVGQKKFSTTACSSLSVHPGPEAAGKSKVEKVGAGLSTEVGESSSYHLARCVSFLAFLALHVATELQKECRRNRINTLEYLEADRPDPSRCDRDRDRQTSRVKISNVQIVQTRRTPGREMDDSNDDGPSSDDKALLARLTALKPSPVRFDSQSPISTQAYDSTDLAARFESLHVRHSPTAPPRHVQPDSPRPHDASSPTLEELIAELECDEQFSLDYADVQEANSVLQEAKRAKRPRDADEGGSKLSDEVANVNDKMDASSASAIRLLDGDPETRDREKYEDEDAEAASSLQRILDELDLEESHTPTQWDTSTPASPQHTSSFFPSPPKSLPASPIATDSQNQHPPPPTPTPKSLLGAPSAAPTLLCAVAVVQVNSIAGHVGAKGMLERTQEGRKEDIDGIRWVI
ncbi:hypothetical protein MMC29_007141 [Sticta canariensis]|nr:hypothetical protein [Sticta canariensis]